MALNRDQAQPILDIDTCAREPIHIPGSIQPFGYLLALSQPNLIIEHASGNCAALLRRDAGALAGQAFEQFLAPTAAQQLRAALAVEHLQTINPLRLELAVSHESELMEAMVHRSQGLLILELEPLTDSAPRTFSQVYRHINHAIQNIGAATSLSELYRVTAEHAKAVSGYQRVMIYRFDAHWNGQVVAEAREPHQQSYLGLHYPASDIPEQARHLYRTNWIRVIPDVAYTPIPIIAAQHPVSGAALDLSHSVLRSVSPMHIQYLRNMGVGASASVSVIKEGALWGLIAMHHEGPAPLSVEMRQALEWIGRMFSAQLAAQQKFEDGAYTASLEAVHQQLLRQMRQASAFMDGLWREGASFLQLTAGCRGGAIAYRDRLTLVGETPAREEVRQLAEWLKTTQGAAPIFHTTSLIDHFPAAAQFSERASGVLAISIPEVEPSYVIWFKPEVVQTVDWGGNPNKALEYDQDGAKLGPRRSFALWRETVRHTALAWTQEEITVIEALRRSIIEVDLERQVRAAMDSNAELDQFASVVAHDLKEPLRGIGFFADFLEEDLRGQLDSQCREHLLEIKQLSSKATTLISELHEYSRVGRLELAFCEVDLNDLVAEVTARLSAVFSERRVQLHRPAPLPTIFCDRVRVAELYANLLANAAKYNDTPQPCISLGADSRGQTPVLYVSDNGIGIPAAARERVFKMFHRLHEPGQYGGGTGVGLAIAKRVVDRHGGRIWIESEPRQGTTFYFTLQPEPLSHEGVRR